MPTRSLQQLNALSKGTLISTTPNREVLNLCFDSRQIINPETTLYIALKGNRDGHLFLKSAYDQGIRMFLVEQIPTWSDTAKCSFIVVTNTLTALQDLAIGVRNDFTGKVIGITGSNGKTIVKEWLKAILAADYAVLASPQSYNSQIGVPLSVWPLNNELHDLGIFEAGISKKGEMARLEQMICPEIGVFTMFGDAHANNFNNAKEKVQEKMKLFANAKHLIYPFNDHLIHQEALKLASAKTVNLWSWSFDDSRARVKIIINRKADHTELQFISHTENVFSLLIAQKDEISIRNAVTCAITIMALGAPINDIIDWRPHLQSLDMRLQLSQGIRGCTIINDAYSFDLTALQSALSFAQTQEKDKPLTLILSDWQQGKDKEVYASIAAILKNQKVTRVLGIGHEITALVPFLHPKCLWEHYPTADAFLKQFKNESFENETIVIKGARSFGFEKIASRLSQKAHKTVLEVNLSALRNNYNVYRQMLSPGVGMMAMVKAAAYGNGSYEVTRLLEQMGVTYFCVAYPDEGIELREKGIQTPIMVLNPEPASWDAMIRFQLEPEIYHLDLLKDYAQLSVEQLSPIHIKLDTGMNRLGFQLEDIDALCQQLTLLPNLKVASIFTHLAASESDLHNDFTQQQAQLFEHGYQKLTETLGYKPLRHILNSAGISRWRQYQYDMVRLGIGLYGIDGNNDVQSQLQVVQTLKASISQVKHLQAGETVGYGRHGVINKDSTIATISIGYADGLFRLAGRGAAQFYVRGLLAPTIGNVCMDMTMIDVSDIPNVQMGDEVEIFGPNVRINALAQAAQTIPYEILTSISNRVTRVYVQE